MIKLQVEEVIVVEGRDDTDAVLKAVDGMTIETHGFGIRKETWGLIEKAYNEKGLIIFTDPDFSGEEIRRKLTEKFPNSKQAYLTKNKATKDGDIGIENARPEDIIDALTKAHFTKRLQEEQYTRDDLLAAGLIGEGNSKERRDKLADRLGIGYSNGKTFLKKLNQFNITKEEFNREVKDL